MLVHVLILLAGIMIGVLVEAVIFSMCHVSGRADDDVDKQISLRRPRMPRE